jgi:hypothetical protein
MIGDVVLAKGFFDDTGLKVAPIQDSKIAVIKTLSLDQVPDFI